MMVKEVVYMGRKAQVVLSISEDKIGTFINKFFGGDKKKALSILSLLVEDMVKDLVVGNKEIKVMVLNKGGDEQYFEPEK